MKRTYEKPQLQTERFDPQDVITTSAASPPIGPLGVGNTNWEITGFQLN